MRKLMIGLFAAVAAAVCGAAFAQGATLAGAETIVRRDSIKNAEAVFTNTGKGTVAFLGGSITEGGGYRNAVMDYLRQRFPSCAFTEVAAGISSTCSDTGAFRVQRDVLSKGRIDLFFVEFAVNDDQDGHFTEEHSIRGMEGIVRQVREANPACDIVMVHFVNPGELQTIQAGETPIPYAAHEKVAAQYGVPTVSIGAELAQLIAAGTWTLEKYSNDGNGHPTAEGGQMAAGKICDLLAAEWTGEVLAETADHTLPEMLDEASYAKGGQVPLRAAVLGSGWNLSLPDWNSIEGNKRAAYVQDPILWSETPGSEFTLSFTGTAAGAFVTSFFKDVGALEVSVDGGAFVTRRMISTWSYNLHYPMTVMLADGLPYGEHTLTVRLAEDHKDAFDRTQDNRAGGRVARIHALCVNGEVPTPAVTGTFVPLSGDLAAAIANASAGDELHLEAGTFAVGSTISSGKALTISGGWNGDGTAQIPGAVTTLDGGGDGSTSATVNGLLNFSAGDGTTELSRLVFARSWASGLKKSGNASLVVTDCRFLDNGYYTGTGNNGYQGLGAYLSGSSSSTEVSFTRCVFSNNVTRTTAPFYNMQGAGLYVQNLKSLTLEQTDFLFNGMPQSFARNGTVIGRESMQGFALYANGAPTVATGCRFVGNCGAAHSANSGSVVYLTGASGGSVLKNCLWTGNLGACFAGGNWTANSGALVVSLNSNTAAVSVENCTMAFNAIEGKEASAGLTVDKGAVTLRSSIIWGNYATRETGNGNVSAQCVAVHASGSLDADYSIFEASGGIYVRSSGTLALGVNMKYVDPQFAAPSTFMDSYLYFRLQPGSNNRQYYFRDTVDFGLLDLHVKSTTGRYAAGEWVADDVLSEAIDKGDPAAAYANEPMPNGNCVNMGFYGNTVEASKSMAVESAKIESCAIDQTKDYTNPHITVTLSDDGAWELPVRLCWGLTQGGDAGDGWEHAVILSEAAHAGDVLSTEFGMYIEHGATVYYRVILGNGAGVDAKADSFVITSELPEGWGKGGGPNVIHVFAGRTGRGTCWLDAVGTLEDALKAVTAERNTIWVSGTLVRAAPANKTSVTVPVTIVGGFKDLDETEPETGSAVVDGATLYNGLVLDNSAAVTVRKVDFVRASEHGFVKTGSGDLTLEKCRFLDNGYGTEVDGRGLLCSGSSGTTVTMTDCVVSGNVARATSEVYGGNGAGASFTTFKSVVLKRVDFLDNGFARSFLTSQSSNHNGNTPGREASRGSALRVNGAPLAATGCRFVGNRCTGHSSGGSGGSTVSVEGASGGTTFANCLFSANATYWWTYNNSTFATRGGALYVNLGNKADAVSLANCTFAHNLLFAGECGASLTVDKGAVEVKNSIFWGNRFGAASKGNEQNAGNFVSAHEIYVKADGSVSFDHSLIASVDAPYVRVATGGTWTPTNVLNDDPLFVTTENEVLAAHARQVDDWRYADYYLPATDLEAFNVHLRSRTGYVDETTGELVKHKGVRSPAIDAGDPATPVGDEPSPNGRRVNLGYYGGTPYASGSALGLMLFVR